MATITITQTRSATGHKPEQRKTLKALGLGKIGRTVSRPDNESVRGMIARVRHLVEVTEGDQA